MDSVRTVRAFAAAWAELRARCAPSGAIRVLAMQIDELHETLRAEHRAGDPRVRDLALARALRESAALRREVRDWLVADASRNSVTREPIEPSPGIAKIKVEGDVGPEQMQSLLDELTLGLAASNGRLLLDLRELRRSDPKCMPLLQRWLDSAGDLRPRRVAVVVEGGLAFVRATHALAGLPGSDWSVGHDEDGAMRWLLEA